MAVGMMPESKRGVLISADERREVMGRLEGGLYDRAEEIEGQFNMARRIPGKEVFN